MLVFLIVIDCASRFGRYVQLDAMYRSLLALPHAGGPVDDSVARKLFARAEKRMAIASSLQEFDQVGSCGQGAVCKCMLVGSCGQGAVCKCMLSCTLVPE